jgi:hypothetical protein
MRGFPVAIQVVEPFGAAFNRMKWMLFQPFDLGKWMVLGFSAFLAALGGGGSFSYRYGGGGGGRQGGPSGEHGGGSHGLSEAMPPEFSDALEWSKEHFLLVGSIVAALMIVGLVVVLVLQWLSCRGQFMFLDNVVRNRAEVKRPWGQFRRQANRLFVLRIVLLVAFMALMFVAAGMGAIISLPDILSREFGGFAIVGIAVAVLLAFTLLVAVSLTNFAIGQFVIPTMYLRGVGVVEGFGVFWREILPGHLGALVGFFFFNLVLTLGGGILIALVGCCTCCIGFLPYLSSVLALPVTVSLRGYSLYFLQQFGEGFRFFADPVAPPPAAPLPPVSSFSDVSAPAASPDVFS